MAAIGTMPDVDVLRQCFRYDPETGEIWHRQRPIGMFKTVRDCTAWNTMFAGKSAISVTGRYPTVSLNRKRYSAHRVAFAMHHGYAPPLQVDHINNDPTDNRICNLRLATQSQNNANRPAAPLNTSGLKGVSWHRRYKKFAANITLNNRSIYLGRYNTKEEAHEAYKAAALRIFGEFARF